jgi:hypothetical protein
MIANLIERSAFGSVSVSRASPSMLTAVTRGAWCASGVRAAQVLPQPASRRA